ncbi:MAG: hypothetical protein ACLR23_09140 [Clostridia bacterium]
MEAILSLLDEPLLTVKDSADITFCNLQVEAACGSGDFGGGLYGCHH